MGMTLEESNGKTEFLKGSIGADVGLGPAGYKAKVTARLDAFNTTGEIAKGHKINTNIGVNLDTGVDVGLGSLGGSFLGFGGNVGFNGIGFQTPLGGISYNYTGN